MNKILILIILGDFQFFRNRQIGQICQLSLNFRKTQLSFFFISVPLQGLTEEDDGLSREMIIVITVCCIVFVMGVGVVVLYLVGWKVRPVR